MKSKPVAVFGLAMVLLVLSLPAFAHHGGGIYDQAHPITLKGTITEFAWANPHVQIFFDVKDEKGNIVHWVCETVSPGKLAREAGWTKNTLKPGDEVEITLQPAKAGTPVGSLQKIMVNGKELTPRGVRVDAY
jgi:hypothetical protein